MATVDCRLTNEHDAVLDDDEEEDIDVDSLSGISGGLSDHFRQFTLANHTSKTSTRVLHEDYTDTTESSSYCSFFDDDTDHLVLEQNFGGDIDVIHKRKPESALLNRHVHFGKITVREYASTVGDHPACQDKCPIALDWKHSETIDYDVETFECKRFLFRRNAPRKLDAEQKRNRILETNPSMCFTPELLAWTMDDTVSDAASESAE